MLWSMPLLAQLLLAGWFLSCFSTTIMDKVNHITARLRKHPLQDPSGLQIIRWSLLRTVYNIIFALYLILSCFNLEEFGYDTEVIMPADCVLVLGFVAISLMVTTSRYMQYRPVSKEEGRRLVEW